MDSGQWIVDNGGVKPSVRSVIPRVSRGWSDPDSSAADRQDCTEVSVECTEASRNVNGQLEK